MSDSELETLEKRIFEPKSNDIKNRKAFILDNKLSEAADRLKKVLAEENKWKRRYCNHCHTSTQ